MIAKTAIRTAYMCAKCYEKDGCATRVFIPDGSRIPRCEKHGPMVRQPNRRYAGSKPRSAK
jgi:hypothetical protein